MKLKLIYNAILNKKKRSEIRNKLSETFGLTAPTILGWLSGRTTPPRKYWSAIAQIFGVSVDELFPVSVNA